ncbi:MAG: double zinc ribbon domain-containing protein [Candidatus Helarchaeota archaeon]
MSEEIENINSLEDIVKKIANDMRKLLSNPIQIGIIDNNNNLKYIDPVLEEKYADFIKSFATGNFSVLDVGEHSLPLSGVNIGFFKLSEKAMIVLYSESGPVGQLLAFKGRMHKYSDYIDKFIDMKLEKGKSKQVEKTAYRVPIKLDGIERKKFSMTEAKVIHLIDGKNTIEDICEKTNLPRLKVDEIIKKYQKKGWIKLKRIIVMEGEQAKKEPKKEEVVKKEAPKITHAESKASEKEIPKTPEAPSPVVPPITIKQPTMDEIYDDINNLLKNTDPISPSIQPSATNQVSLSNPPPLVQPTTSITPETEQSHKPNITSIPEEIPSAPKAVPIPEEIPSAPKAVPIPEEIPSAPKAVPVPEEIPSTPKATPIPEEIPSAPKAAPVPEEISKQEVLDIPMKPVSGPDVEVMVAEEVNEELFNDLMNIMNETEPIEQSEVVEQPEKFEAAKASDLMGIETQEKAEPIVTKSPEMPIAMPITEETDLEKEIPKAEVQEQVNETIKPLDETLSKLTDVLAKTEEKQQAASIDSQKEQEELKSIDEQKTIEESSLDDYLKIKEIEQTELEEKPTKPTIIGAKAICPHCKSVVFMMEKICPECKKPLKVCPHCKAPITLFARICPECGSIL